MAQTTFKAVFVTSKFSDVGGFLQGPSEARNMDNKEKVSGYKLIAKNGDEWEELIDVRFYMGRSASASKVYCSAWFRGPVLFCSGRGSAGGYGYCKKSAALAGAIESAGIKLCRLDNPGTPADIGGAGETAMASALHAIGLAMGISLDNQYLVSY